jgi:hypothetical protein
MLAFILDPVVVDTVSNNWGIGAGLADGLVRGNTLAFRLHLGIDPLPDRYDDRIEISDRGHGRGDVLGGVANVGQ